MMMVFLVKEKVSVPLQSGASYWNSGFYQSLDADLFPVQPVIS